MSWVERLQPHGAALVTVLGLMSLEAGVPAGTLLVLRGAMDGVLAGDTAGSREAGVALVALAAAGAALKLARTAISKRVASC